MKNRLNHSLSLIAEDNELIPYRKSLRKYCHSVTATILFQQLIYWFSKYETFYKFLSPCDNPDYSPGDSWEEELGFSKAEFNAAFDKIGVRHLSKSLFEKAQEANNVFESFSNEGESFGVKYFASYFNRTTGKTHYFCNFQAVNNIFTINEQSQYAEMNKLNLRKSTKLTHIYNTETITENLNKNQKEEEPKKINETIDKLRAICREEKGATVAASEFALTGTAARHVEEWLLDGANPDELVLAYQYFFKLKDEWLNGRRFSLFSRHFPDVVQAMIDGELYLNKPIDLKSNKKNDSRKGGPHTDEEIEAYLKSIGEA